MSHLHELHTNKILTVDQISPSPLHMKCLPCQREFVLDLEELEIALKNASKSEIQKLKILLCNPDVSWDDCRCWLAH